MLYDFGLLKARRLPCRIISVGNLTVGGTGKTPTVEYLAKNIRDQGQRVCIISRGYKRRQKGLVLVSDGREPLAGAENGGDEPYLLAKKLPGVPVIVDADRIRGASYAVDHFSPDVLILDDAYQHRRIARDVDVVLIDARHGFGNGFLLPAGPLREPKSALKRADCVLLTKLDKGEFTARLGDIVRNHGNAVLAGAVHRPLAFFDLDERILDLNQIAGKKVLAFSGIARPDSFYELLERLGASVVVFKRFKDHHFYTPEDKRTINALAEQHAVGCLVTTEKDKVRFSPEDFILPVWTLMIELQVSYGETDLLRVCSIPSHNNEL